MLTVALSASVLAIAGAIIACLWRVVVVFQRTNPPVPTQSAPVTTEDLYKRTLELEGRLDTLTVAVSEGIAGYQRHEKRIQKTVTSARRLVGEAGLEHAGIAAEFAELEPPNAEGIEPLPAVPEPMEEVRTVRIPGGALTLGVG